MSTDAAGEGQTRPEITVTEQAAERALELLEQ